MCEEKSKGEEIQGVLKRAAFAGLCLVEFRGIAYRKVASFPPKKFVIIFNLFYGFRFKSGDYELCYVLCVIIMPAPKSKIQITPVCL